MIAFFPKPYSDELAYSWFSRYHIRSGHMAYSTTAADLFVEYGKRPSIEFIIPLTNGAKAAIERYMPYERFLEKHTMFPYYARFIPLERRLSAWELIQTGDRRFADALYITKNRGVQRTHLRYCPICAQLDRGQYGETYWHRHHQLPWISACPEHYCRLINSPVSLVGPGSGFRLISAEEVVPHDAFIDTGVSDLEGVVARFVSSVFDADMNLQSDIPVGKFIRSRLEGTKYTSLRGEQVFARLLFRDAQQFYGHSLPNTLSAWFHIQKICCAQNFHAYDICLLALFLGITTNDLLSMQLPEQTLQQRFDAQLRDLRAQGLTQRQVAAAMGVSLHAIKSVDEQRYRSARAQPVHHISDVPRAP